MGIFPVDIRHKKVDIEGRGFLNFMSNIGREYSYFRVKYEKYLVLSKIEIFGGIAGNLSTVCSFYLQFLQKFQFLEKLKKFHFLKNFHFLYYII